MWIRDRFKIDPSKIFSIIGKGGATIREITEKYKVSVDMDKDNGTVKVSGDDSNNISQCAIYIKELANSSKAFVKKEKLNFEKLYNIDDVLSGEVLRITDFGAFVELPKGGEGLLHISKLSKQRVHNVNDILSINDIIDVRVLKLSSDRIELASSSF